MAAIWNPRKPGNPLQSEKALRHGRDLITKPVHCGGTHGHLNRCKICQTRQASSVRSKARLWSTVLRRFDMTGELATAGLDGSDQFLVHLRSAPFKETPPNLLRSGVDTTRKSCQNWHPNRHRTA
jgi:hypothetical protein